jgi:sugar O-acyltransferase (sialic acid O-acetyltransferase NeuD family)
MTDKSQQTLIWGAKGHAKVVRPILEAMGLPVTVIYDISPDVPSPFTDVARLDDERALETWIGNHGNRASFVIAIGGTHGRERVKIGDRLTLSSLKAPTLIHTRAWVAETATIGEGSQVLALAGVSECTVIGRYCIINTNATVDHDCIVGDGVHIMPGATIAGEVRIGAFATIGSNATIMPRVSIGEGAVVGAGAVVTRDVAANTIVVGNPARIKA